MPSNANALKVIKVIQNRESELITISEVAETLNCTYEYARQIVKAMVKEDQLVRLPHRSPTGHDLYALPDSSRASHEFKLLAAGKDIYRWMGDTLTRDEYIERIQEAIRNGYYNPDDYPIGTQLMGDSLALLDYVVQQSEHNPLKFEVWAESHLSHQDRQLLRAELERRVQSLDWINESYRALLDNPELWK